MLLVEHFVNHFRGRVGVGVAQTIIDSISLFELLGCVFHRHLRFLYLQVILIYKLIITYDIWFVKNKMRIILIYFFKNTI